VAKSEEGWFEMEHWLTYWYMFPLSIVIATLAMASSMEGGVLFAPTFILLFPLVGSPTLSPAEAVGVSLITEVFGFSSGVLAYWRQRAIDFSTARFLVMFTVPMAVVGGIMSYRVPGPVLMLIFSVALLVFAFLLYRSHPEDPTDPILPEQPGVDDGGTFYHNGRRYHFRRIITADGEEYRYATHRPPGALLSIAGGFLAGLMGIGIGEIETTQFVVRNKMPVRVATATAVLIVAVTVLTASATHVVELVRGGFSIPWNLVAMTVPGVLIGGQLGPRLNRFLPGDLIKRGIAVLFVVVSVLMAWLALR